jgi:hypothetical protein
MDRHGIPPRISIVEQMARLLVAQRAPTTSIGRNWASRFVKQDKRLKSKYNHKYDYQRSQCEDLELLRAWFQRILAIVAEHGILEDDYYNFDETGFQMGVIATVKVVTGSERAGRPHTVQPGNHKWVTIIKAINTRGFAIPPLIIFEAVMH